MWFLVVIVQVRNAPTTMGALNLVGTLLNIVMRLTEEDHGAESQRFFFCTFSQ